MRAFEDMVYSTVVRLTADGAIAEDLTQEAFLRAYERFDALRGNPAAGGWLKTVATNLALNHLVRYRRRWRLFSELVTEPAEEEPLEPVVAALDDLLAATDAEQRRALVHRSLAALPAHQRVPLALYHFEEMGYQEIATRLGVSLSKVKTDILRGRIALARRLAGSERGAAHEMRLETRRGTP
ncbi:MAG: RNA polymerase sigma factor [Steroidobacteraceae bacterium]